jgi:hypothetical protein
LTSGLAKQERRFACILLSWCNCFRSRSLASRISYYHLDRLQRSYGKSVVRAVYRSKVKLYRFIVQVLDFYPHHREWTYSLCRCAIDCYIVWLVVKYVSFIVAVRRPSVFVRFSCCGCCRCCCGSSSCSSSTSAPIVVEMA